MPVSYFRFFMLIRYSEKKTLRCHFQEIRKNRIHVSLAKVFKHMERHYCIKPPQLDQFLRKQVSLCEPYLLQLLLNGQFLSNLKSRFIDIDTYHLRQKRDTFSDQQRQEARSAA